MNANDVRKFIAKGESEELELRVSASNINEVVKTACAMANTRHGHIVIGVEERANPIDPEESFRLVGIPKLRDVLQ
ncbi:MAG: ATP-binding protein [Pirellula sp.]